MISFSPGAEPRHGRLPSGNRPAACRDEDSRTPTLASFRRARPLLGTFVEVSASATNRRMATAAVERAFAAIVRVQRGMSPHDPESDLSRLRATPPGRAIAIEAWTWRVLKRSHELFLASGGCFDPTLGANPPGTGSWEDVELLTGRRVRLRRRIAIDLGGIAKGFAVDRAIDAMRRAGAVDGIVNAGGDLRAFGGTARPVHIRHPFSPCGWLAAGTLRDQAFATSSNMLDPAGAGRLRRHDGRRLWIGRGSVSVRARQCVIADALCKVVAAIGPRGAAPLLDRHGATAIVITARGTHVTERTANAA